MFYRRSHSGARPISETAARAYTTAALLAYPLGAATLRFGPDGPLTAFVGFGLIVATFACAVAIFGTELQRIVGEEVSRLDEYELTLRSRAMFGAYAVFSALALGGIFYAAVATDAGLWVPSTYDEFNGIFWGFFIYAMVLPSAVLAWVADRGELGGAD